MKKLMLLACSALLLTASCAKKNLPTASETPAQQVAAIHSKYDAGKIAEGKTIFEANCGKCHKLKQPGTQTVQAWNRILPKMSKKAHLTTEQADLVRAWIITNAKAS